MTLVTYEPIPASEFTMSKKALTQVVLTLVEYEWWAFLITQERAVTIQRLRNLGTMIPYPNL